MTSREARLVASAALPCPFCGERLVPHDDHHGYWVAHDRSPGPCFLSTIQLLDTVDLAGWNQRVKP